jgi:ABC-2 type transport system permease protein
MIPPLPYLSSLPSDVLYIIAKIVASNFGFSHNLYRFSSSPGVPFSDINQYGNFLATHNWYVLYWFGVTLILAALGYGLWHRGPAQPLKTRLKGLGYYLFCFYTSETAQSCHVLNLE